VPGPRRPPHPLVAARPREIGVYRRQFLNRSVIGADSCSGSAFFAPVFVAFLWPTAAPAASARKISVGKITDIETKIARGGGFALLPRGPHVDHRVPRQRRSEKAARSTAPAELTGMEQGVVALYQKCVHLGCRVPSCATSKWFECPCHGSQYNQVGEKKAGPAPRGLDRFAMEVSRTASSP
jgi:cytochrome b6-f complex iron-sulfur subunit